jgi:hypothetical protein
MNKHPKSANCDTGFGDITPITWEGRFVVAASILAGVAVFPYQLSKLAEASGVGEKMGRWT